LQQCSAPLSCDGGEGGEGGALGGGDMVVVFDSIIVGGDDGEALV